MILRLPMPTKSAAWFDAAWDTPWHGRIIHPQLVIEGEPRPELKDCLENVLGALPVGELSFSAGSAELKVAYELSASNCHGWNLQVFIYWMPIQTAFMLAISSMFFGRYPYIYRGCTLRYLNSLPWNATIFTRHSVEILRISPIQIPPKAWAEDRRNLEGM